MARKDSSFTVDMLENVFVYLGCANIETSKAMDGAVPIALLKPQGDTVAEFRVQDVASMKTGWGVKMVWFRGEHLAMTTLSHIHWSELSVFMERTIKHLNASGRMCKLPSDIEAYAQLYYSEINRYGKFEKFPVQRRRVGPVVVSKIFNPSWVFSIHGNEQLLFLREDSQSLAKDINVRFVAPFMCGLTQSIKSYWQVATRFDDVCPSLTLLTDPTGIKEFWKLRDVPAGAKRRSALLHWVSDHWKQMRHDPDVEHYVRKHLRGAQQFTQGSFSARITPSEVDTIENESAKKDRAAMRQLKHDRRRRQKRLEEKLAK